MRFFLIVSVLLFIAGAEVPSTAKQFKVDGTVLELEESNFDSAISAFDYIFVDFYAPWCIHCQHLAPQLDEAARLLFQSKEPIVIAKVNADKFKKLNKKYEVHGYPTLKLFIHGVPIDYDGPRKADLLVKYLKKFVAPDVSVLNSDLAISDFLEVAGTYFPIYIGFGLNETVISNQAVKYKEKAWFAVAKDFSEDVRVFYDFDKVPALVSLHPIYSQQNVFYGPFEDDILGDFIKLNLLPPVVPVNPETLKLLNTDKRKTVLTIMEDEVEEKSQKLIKLLKAAASANRDLVFAYVGVKQWEDFADSFEANRNTKLPKMIVWDGSEEYLSVIGSESLNDEDQGSQILRFLEGYREGRTALKGVNRPSLMSSIKSLIGVKTFYIIVFLVAGLILLCSLVNKEEPLRVGTRDQVDHTRSFVAETSESRSGEKED
ncbi:hypothetical protein SLEP1_g20618 [Rubroshorea leprosula]|uniref:Thioredoxin domain-containing protein n=1 Tax=Rubroshorea leprosula TaxID=152421 RepID=A0AAV5J3A5_9ROSI|nr:hypothetical protein SLEP1_g20618 [Rubroshorea leprosula]